MSQDQTRIDEYVAAIVAAAPDPTAEQVLIVKRSGLLGVR